MIYRAVGKRLLDIAVSALAMPVAAALAVPVAAAIKLDDGGPIIYRSTRLGRDGRPFSMYKFRSMSVGAPDVRNPDGSTFNAADDPRVSRVGRVLRSTSLDELPQLVNVVKGDMSLVGPRPSPPGNMSRYPTWYLPKFSIRPGITGLTQVRHRNAANLLTRYRTDIDYLGSISLLGDLRILAATLAKVVRRSQIYSTSGADVPDHAAEAAEPVVVGAHPTVAGHGRAEALSREPDRSAQSSELPEGTGHPDQLVLFTNVFPFHRGEEYLEAEFPHLKEAFDHITIVPMMYREGMAITYDAGPDVRVIAHEIPISVTGKARYVARHLPQILAERRLSPLSETRGNPAKVAYDLYFTARSLELWRLLREPLREAVGGTPTVAYAYRLYVSAYVAAEFASAPWSNVVRTVARAHRYDVLERRSPLGYLPQRRYLCETLDAIYPVSAEGLQELRESWPVYTQRFHLERLGVGPNPPTNRSLSVPATLLSVSTYLPVKRLPAIADVVAHLVRHGCAVRWVHYGAGPDAEQEAFTDYLAGLDLPADTVELRGYLAHTQLLEVYASGEPTLMVNLSASEGVPVSLMEACAAGLPIVATAVGGNPELVHDADNGLIVSPDDDAAQVAQRIRSILEGPKEDYARMCERALEVWDREWNARANFSRFASLLRTGGTS
ncbi:MAG: sugar transferase [Bowdeniella nasicola]|nr:sugar transferase [Bowdeniella nasicola]